MTLNTRFNLNCDLMACQKIQHKFRKGAVVMYNDDDRISETYEDTATGKLQIRRLQPPHAGLTTVLREKLRISTNNFYFQKL